VHEILQGAGGAVAHLRPLNGRHQPGKQLGNG